MFNLITKLGYIFRRKSFFRVFLTILIFLGLYAYYWSAAPSDFPPKDTVITIEEGSSLSKVAELLHEKGMIKSILAYKIYVTLLGGQKKIIAGDYLFEHPQSAFGIAYRTVNGLQDIDQVKVTIPEGIASYDIARLLAKSMPNFDSKEFLALAQPQEGYLFPDTYYFYETMTPKQIVDMMRANFDKKIKNVSISIALSGRSFEDVLKMASIVEKEANKTDDRRMIAGILWKRFDNKHLLQVDAPFFYTLGKDSSELTRSDLTSDSPYNLYKHLGLPPTPINNPGLKAIIDTVNPTKSPYWFYLSDSKGETHYAVDHEGHLANKEKYIQ